MSKETDIEEEIPFWEFLDIEYDAGRETFKFVNHTDQQFGVRYSFFRKRNQASSGKKG